MALHFNYPLAEGDKERGVKPALSYAAKAATIRGGSETVSAT